VAHTDEHKDNTKLNKYNTYEDKQAETTPVSLQNNT